MLGVAVAGKTGGRDRVRPFAGGRGDLRRAHCRNIRSGETAEQGHAWCRRGRTGGSTGRVTAG